MFNIKKCLFSFFLFIFIVLPLFLSGMTKASIIKEKKLIKELEGKKKEEEEKRKTLKANRSKVEKEIENLDILAKKEERNGTKKRNKKVRRKKKKE